MYIRIIWQRQEASLADVWYLYGSANSPTCSFSCVKDAYDQVNKLIRLYGELNKYLVVRSEKDYRSNPNISYTLLTIYTEDIILCHI